MRYHKNVQNIFLTLLIFVSTFQFTYAVSQDTAESSPEEQNIDLKELIIGHISDSYQWHILTTPNGKDISIHLPVILYSNTSGLHIFSSKKITHGHSYKRFHIAEQGKNKGDIVRELPNGEVVKPLDLSITRDAFAIIISSLLLIIVFIYIANVYKKRTYKAPTGLQNALEPLITFIRDDIAKKSIGEKKYEKYTPFLLTVFFFILLNNLWGLLPVFPGGINVTANLYVTAILAFFTFIITTVGGNKYYWRDVLNTPGVPWWFKFPIPLMPLIEIMQMFIRPIVLAIRLFANMLAEHIIILSFLALIFVFGSMHYMAGYGVSVFAVAFEVFIILVEILVGIVQAYIFTILSALYFGLSVPEEE